MYAKKRSGKKVAAMLLAVVLVIGIAAGGTLAWLMDSTETVTNTFTVGDIDIELKEHKLDSDGKLTATETDTANNYKIVPGDTQPKDPFVRFTKDSEPCWLFVKVEEENNTVEGDKKYVTYTVDSSWTKLDAVDGVYYKKLDSLTAANTTHSILASNQVSYSQDLTKANLNAVTDSTKPRLIFTAYAVQLEAAADAAAAWAIANPASGN